MVEKFFAILGLARDASSDDIEAARKRLAKQWHPDKHPEGTARNVAEAKMKAVNEAADSLLASAQKAKHEAERVRATPKPTNAYEVWMNLQKKDAERRAAEQERVRETFRRWNEDAAKRAAANPMPYTKMALDMSEGRSTLAGIGLTLLGFAADLSVGVNEALAKQAADDARQKKKNGS